MKITTYVLWWRYHDGSGQGIERVYFDEAHAADDLHLMTRVTTDRDWSVTTIISADDVPKRAPKAAS